jgi:two-component system, NarL family, sensor kinase
LAWGLGAAGVAAGLAGLLLFTLRGSHPVPDEVDAGAQQVLIGITAVIGFCGFGPLIARRHPGNPIGWLFCAAGLSAGLLISTSEYAIRALIIDPGSLPGGEAAAWFTSWLWIPFVLVPGTVILLLFPDGRLPSRRWRPVLWFSVALLFGIFAGVALTTGELGGFTTEQNPIGFLPHEVNALGALILPAVLLSFASVVVRYRSSDGEERQQLRWIAAAAVLYVSAQLLELALTPVAPGVGGWLTLIATGAMIAAAGIAVLKYRLYDLEVVINRTLVYGALTAGVLTIYIGAVSGLGALLDSSGIGISLAATAAVAVAFAPLRSLLQRRINRIMYGDREEPYRAISRLGERLGSSLEPDAVLPTIVASVAEGLRLPYVAIELDEAGRHRIAAEHGEAQGGEPVRLPLEYRGEVVGGLLVLPRSPKDSFSAADLRLLGDLSRQAGVAAHAVRLRQDLVRSRERLVVTREEERRRLRRDLHDGLGPTLAGIGLEIESVRALASSDPKAADALLARLKLEVQDAIGDIRRIAYDLRPPTLDELGLVAAVREQAARLGVSGNGLGGTPGPRVNVEVPGDLPSLPAAVEVAAYRIALEALTNVSRHAEAARCTIRISVNGSLELEVSDDGRGVDPASGAGVGLTSMRERAEELGGELSVTPAEGGGTVVRARLPVESQ